MRYMKRRILIMQSEAVTAAGVILAPMAAVAFALALWGLFAQTAVAGQFPISQGALADWRLWMLIAVTLEVGAWRLGAQR